MRLRFLPACYRLQYTQYTTFSGYVAPYVYRIFTNWNNNSCEPLWIYIFPETYFTHWGVATHSLVRKLIIGSDNVSSPDQWWPFLHMTFLLWLQGISHKNTRAFLSKITFENHVCKLSAIPWRLPYTNSYPFGTICRSKCWRFSQYFHWI